MLILYFNNMIYKALIIFSLICIVYCNFDTNPNVSTELINKELNNNTRNDIDEIFFNMDERFNSLESLVEHRIKMLDMIKEQEDIITKYNTTILNNIDYSDYYQDYKKTKQLKNLMCVSVIITCVIILCMLIC